MIAEALRPGRSVRATGSRTGVRDLTGHSVSVTRVIATIGRDAMVVRGISVRIAILNQHAKPARMRRRRPGFRLS
jgi:hypothetical protein